MKRTIAVTNKGKPLLSGNVFCARCCRESERYWEGAVLKAIVG